MGLSFHHIPERAVTGAYILHAGLEKWQGAEERAQGLHAMASGAYPPLGSLKPEQFTKLLAVGEMTTGALLLAPVVSNRMAGTALTAFAGGLVGLYFRTPGMRQEGSIWPSPQGLAVSKDSWMLGIGLGLLLDGGSKKRGKAKRGGGKAPAAGAPAAN